MALARKDRALLEVARRWPVRSLATPPEGSGLRPVGGDSGWPLLGHTVDYIRLGAELGRERYARFGPVSWMGAFGTRVVVVAGPAATQCGPDELREGVLAGRMDLPDRQVLPPRPDADELRRAPHASTNHAGGVHPRPARRLCGPARAASTRGRGLMVDRRPRAALPAAQGRSPWTSPPTSSWAAAEVRTRAPSTRPSSRPSARPAPSSDCRCPALASAPASRADASSRTTSTTPPRRTCRGRRRPVRRPLPGDHRRRRELQRRGRRQPHDLPDDGRTRHLHHHHHCRRLLPGQASSVAGGRPARVDRPSGRTQASTPSRR